MHKKGFIQSFLLGAFVIIIMIGAVRYFRKTNTPVVSLNNSADISMVVTADTSHASGGTVPATSAPKEAIKPFVVYSKVATGDYTVNLTSKDGYARTYVVYIPKGYDSSKKYPVLLALHGGFGTAGHFESSTHFSTLADERGFIVVYGQGYSFSTRISAPVWNAGACCGSAVETQKNIDDVGYVRSIVSQIEVKYNIDSTRIFATGMSNGGMFSNRLACEAADIISGAAIVSGTIQVSTCAPSKKIPILLIHGTADTNVPYNGGTGSTAVNKSTYIPVEQEFADWGKRNGCSGSIVKTSVTPLETTDGKTVDRLSFPSCVGQTVLYRVNGGIHEWPGGGTAQNALEKGAPTKVMDASKTIVDFLGL